MLAVLLLAGSCTDADEATGGVDDRRQAHELVSMASRDASPEARAALEDGVVTQAEFEQGAARLRDCVAEAGAGVVAFEIDPASGEATFGLDTGTSDLDLAQQREAVFESCRRREIEALELQWSLQHMLGSEERRRLREAMVACLQAGGEQVTDWPRTEIDDPALEARCYDESLSTLGLLE